MKYRLAITSKKFFEAIGEYNNQCNRLSELSSSDIPDSINNFTRDFSAFLKNSIVPSITELDDVYRLFYWEATSFKHDYFLNNEEENMAYNLEKIKKKTTLFSGYLKMIYSFDDLDEPLEMDSISKKIDFVLTQLNKSFDDHYYSISTILKLNEIRFREGEPEEIVEDLKKRGYVIPKEQHLLTEKAKISVKGAKYIERKNKIGKHQKVVSTHVIFDSREKMDEMKYFEISKSAKIPLRCPILNYCARRANTIYFYSDYSEEARGRNVFETLKDAGELPDDFEKKMIQIQGEAVTWSKSANLIYFHNTCPEVNLFDSDNALHFAKKTASISGEWDNLRHMEKFKDVFYKHYSQCAEYCSHAFDKSTHKKGRKRSPISQTLRFEIFQRDNFTCQYCGLSKDQKAVLVIDHVTPFSDGGKDEYSNLITSCQECNSGKSNKII